MCDEPVVQVRDLQVLGTSVWQQLNTQEQSSRGTRGPGAAKRGGKQKNPDNFEKGASESHKSSHGDRAGIAQSDSGSSSICGLVSMGC